MQNNQIARQVARWVTLGALFLIPLTPLLVADTYFFPFITGKAFFFRILIEVAVCAWGVLALLDKEYRPRVSAIGITVVAFVAWMFVADLFAVNVAKAFWSNFERMEGWVLLIHLLGFFVVSSAVLRVEKKWRAWFLTSLAVSLVVVGYALLQLGGTLAIHQGSTRIDATLGNSAYLAIYFLFNVFIASWLALTERRAWLTWLLISLAALEGILIFFTETRGTIIGLVLGLAVAAVLTAFTAGKRVRQYAMFTIIGLMIIVSGFFFARSSAFVQQNHILQRIASISLADGSTRFTIWHMAFEGVAARPIVGWGQEGFNYVFNTYYEPSLYQQEQWFDRAHNAFIDWLTVGGIPAFLLYVALFASASTLLWRSSELSRPERIALTAVLVGYAVHNLFVFDNIYSYIYFFAVLAFIDSQVARESARCAKQPIISPENGVTYALPVAAVVALTLVGVVNLPGMRVATELITALTPSSTGVSGNLVTFQDLTQHPAFAEQEIREQVVSFAASVAQNKEATNTERGQAAALSIAEMQKEVTAYPLDAREHLELSYAYRAAGDLPNALKEVKVAEKLSPRKEVIFIEAGGIEWEQGNVKAAQADFSAAYALGPQFKDLATYAAAGDIGVGDIAGADAILKSVYGTTAVDSDLLAAAYYHAKAWSRLISIWKIRAAAPNASAQTWFGLAAAYYAAGENEQAIATIRTAVVRHPEVAASGAAVIAQIEEKAAGK